MLLLRIIQVAFIVLLSSCALRAQAAAPAYVTVYFTVKDGKLGVDENQTLAQPNFKQSLAALADPTKIWSPDLITSVYFSQINEALGQQYPFAYWFFQVDFSKRLDDVEHAAAPMQNLTATWAKYRAQYKTWRDSVIKTGDFTASAIAPFPPSGPPFIDSNGLQVHYGPTQGNVSGLSAGILPALRDIFANTFLQSVWAQNGEVAYNARMSFTGGGALDFYISPLPTAADVKIQVLNVTAGTDEAAIVNAANTYLSEQKPLWLYPQKLSARVQAFFQFHGLDLQLTQGGKLPWQGNISQIEAISFDDSVPDKDAWRKKLAGYYLPRREAEVLDAMTTVDAQKAAGIYFEKVPSKKDADGGITPEVHAYFDLAALRKLVYGARSPNAGPPPLYTNVYTDASYSLAQLGYVADLQIPRVPAPGWVVIYIAPKTTPTASQPAASGGTEGFTSTGTTPPQAASAPGPDAVNGTSAGQAPTAPPAPAKPGAAAAAAPAAATDKKPFGFSGSVGVTYLPDQGVKTVVNLKQDLAKINGGTLTINAGYLKDLLGSLGYSNPTDLLGPGGTFSTQGYTDVDPRRILRAQDIDERITGGEADISAPWGFDTADQSLDVKLTGAWRNISLSSPVPLGSSSYNVVSVDGKAAYEWAYDPLQPASCFQASLETQQYAECSPSTVVYSREDLRLGVRHYFIDLFTYEGAAWLGTSSAGTPAFDEISVGSPDTVRTLRADYELGRTAWSVQNEIWFPIPGMDCDSSADQKIYTTLYRQCRLSVFADAGRAWDNINTDHGTLIVPGIGFRFQISDKLVFKADVGYGFGTAGHPAGAGTSIGLSTGYNF